MTIYDELQPVAAAILKEFKQGTIKLIRVTAGDGPAHNPGPSSVQFIPLDAVARGASFKYVKDGFCIASDLEITSAVLAGVTVTKNDFIQVDGLCYKILHDVSVPAAGTRVAWKFLVRQTGGLEEMIGLFVVNNDEFVTDDEDFVTNNGDD